MPYVFEMRNDAEQVIFDMTRNGGNILGTLTVTGTTSGWQEIDLSSVLPPRCIPWIILSQLGSPGASDGEAYTETTATKVRYNIGATSPTNQTRIVYGFYGQGTGTNALPSGWQITLLNDNDAYSIGDRFPVWGLVGRGQVSGAGRTTKTVTFTGGQYPLMAVKPNGCNAAVEQLAYNSSTNTWTFTIGIYYPESGSWTVDWYIYDKTPTAKSTGWIFEIYDASENVLVSSKYPPLAIVAPFNPGVSTFPATQSFASGRSYAILATPRPYYFQSVETIENDSGVIIGTQVTTLAGGWAISGGDITRARYTHNGWDTMMTFDRAPATIMVIDVTNL